MIVIPQLALIEMIEVMLLITFCSQPSWSLPDTLVGDQKSLSLSYLEGLLANAQ